MKISKSLLKTIALGISVATLTTACSVTKERKAEKKQEKLEAERQKMEHKKWEENCPTCGMG